LDSAPGPRRRSRTRPWNGCKTCRRRLSPPCGAGSFSPRRWKTPFFFWTKFSLCSRLGRPASIWGASSGRPTRGRRRGRLPRAGS